MKLERRSDGWWIVRLPPDEDCGPYATKAEAEDGRRGLERFWKHRSEPGFLSVDTLKRKP